MLKSLDPRVSRLGLPDETPISSKDQLDQLPTFEVFVQPKDDRPFQHEGIVHASDEELAFLFAKEQFSRRYTCTGMWIIKTANIHTTPFTEGEASVYDELPAARSSDKPAKSWDVFHLLKRGKQHKFAGSVMATDEYDALIKAAEAFGGGQKVYNVWIVPSTEVFRSDEETREIWHTLPEKSFRDAISYKAGDKIKEYKERQS